MEALGHVHLYLGLPFRQTEGLIKSHLQSKAKTPTYSAIWKRVNKLDIKYNPKLGGDIVIAIDSTVIKVANRGEWMRQKWQKRRGFLKIHVAVDVKSKQITGIDITDDHFHDSRHFVSLVEQSKKFGNVTKALADGAYDTKDDFSYLYDQEIIPRIKTRKNSSINCSFSSPIFLQTVCNCLMSNGNLFIIYSLIRFDKFNPSSQGIS